MFIGRSRSMKLRAPRHPSPPAADVAPPPRTILHLDLNTVDAESFEGLLSRRRHVPEHRRGPAISREATKRASRSAGHVFDDIRRNVVCFRAICRDYAHRGAMAYVDRVLTPVDHLGPFKETPFQ